MSDKIRAKSDKSLERSDKMATEYIAEAKEMAGFIVGKSHRGPGDTIDAAMKRAERLYGAPAKWLHRLRYRPVEDMPISAFAAIVNAYRAAHESAERAFAAERELAHVRNSKILGLADLVAGAKGEGVVK